MGQKDRVRLRLFDQSGKLIADSWQLAPPNFRLTDPAKEPWQRNAARALDDAIDFIVDAKPLPLFRDYLSPREFADGPVQIHVAPDRTHIVSARHSVGNQVLVTDQNARDIRRLVRAERSRLGYIIGLAALVSTLLSLFLARTIVRPIRKLARAAVRVRTGRDREVMVPRLPSRNDEIGMLARALSDMSQTLRQRIDASESFAADVTHEMKNPLASLRSAIEGFGRVKDKALQKQLLGIMDEDVRRLDRLITDIGELSRLDAQLTRVRFLPVDLGPALEKLIKARNARAREGDVKLAYARPLKNSAVVMGEESRIVRVVENLLDNAISFSPAGGVVRLTAARDGAEVLIAVEDDGPGIPKDAREAIFERFHSYRPDQGQFGKHSGLGLSIAQTIVNGHNGRITASSRAGSERGARFEVRLPAVPSPDQ
jgi:two-component system, OmpR family, sensor histidine kinase ChvG